MSHVFPGDSHVPWASNAAKFYTVDSLVSVFLYNIVCTGVTGVNEVGLNTEAVLFPNPATDLVNIKSSESIAEVIVYDQTGRVVLDAPAIKSRAYELNTTYWTGGVYFVKIMFTNANNAPIIRSIAVQN